MRKALPLAVALTLAVSATTVTSVGCRAPSKVTGIYVVCGPRWGEMLQLTQASDKITGTLSTAEISGDTVKGKTTPITGGALDGAQLTLTFNSGWMSTNLSGIRDGDTVTLQRVGDEGDVLTSTYKRGSVAEFTGCADQLQQNAKLAAQVKKAGHDAEEWMRNAKLHAERLPNVRANYVRIQARMQELVEREKKTSNRQYRAEIFKDVVEKLKDGEELDADVYKVWDEGIKGQLSPVAVQLVSVRAAICNQGEDKCRLYEAAWSKLSSVSNPIMQQMTELKTYQAHAKTLREATFAEAERLAQ